MRDYVLTCCSTADMPNTFFTERDIPYVCFHFIMDGKTYPDDLGQSMSFEEFYKRLAGGSESKTSQVNVAEYKHFFEPFLKEDLDILHVSLSSGISGAYNSAIIASAELMKQYPSRKIEIIDSRGASSGYGLFIDRLADIRDKGASFTEIHQWALENRLFIHHWFFSSDLSFYIKGGRVSKTEGMLGTLLKICPVLNMDTAGHLVPREKVRSTKNAIKGVVQKMTEHAKDGVEYSGKCFISHSACYEDAKAVADMVENLFPKLNGKVMINSVGTVIGSHTGPGTVALFFVGDERL
ncbi:MAG: DegV family protein [Anaerolineaceae bacterium]|nr:DegV family protein [Anaerolineaceae bacterium]